MSVKLRRRKLESGNTSLYLDIYNEGRREYEFLKLYLEPGEREKNKETLRLAESIRAKRQIELQAHRNGFTAGFKRDADFIEYFARQKAKKNESDTAWHNTLEKLKDFTGGHLKFKHVTPEWLERFQAYLLEEVAQITARGYEKKVVAALNQAVKDRIIPQNPADYIERIPAVESERTFLSIDEIRRFSKAPIKYPDVKRAFLFSCYTGLRISDVRALKWKHVKDGRLHFVQRKTSGREYLPLSQQAKKLLGSRGAPNGKVFELPADSTVNVHLRKCADAADIDKHINFHVSRHTYAVQLLSNGVDLYTVSKLLGHKSIQTTEIYANIVDEKKQEAVDSLPELDNE